MRICKGYLLGIGMLCLLPFVQVRGEGSRTWDKIWSLPAIGVPIIVHSPETNWGFGAGVQGYFKLPDAERTSIVYGDGCYTLNKQYYISVGGTIYFGGSTPWFMLFRGGYRNYPDTYYGIGNTITEERLHGTPYTSQRGTAHIETQLYLPANWSIGPLFDFIHEKTGNWENEEMGKWENEKITNDQINDKIVNRPYSEADRLTVRRKEIVNTMWALGVVTQYDTRDTLYYPHKGIFFKASAAHYEPALGSTARMTHLQADLRQFIPLPKDIIFAWQFKTEWALSDEEETIPFQILPTLGGQDLVRGVRRNMFRDNVMMALQAEFRFPIWNFLRLHAFAGIGDVYNTDHWNWATPKIGYGLGLRIGINDAHINIRLDVARNNIYKNWNTWESYAFYLTATEAF